MYLNLINILFVLIVLMFVFPITLLIIIFTIYILYKIYNYVDKIFFKYKKYIWKELWLKHRDLFSTISYLNIYIYSPIFKLIPQIYTLMYKLNLKFLHDEDVWYKINNFIKFYFNYLIKFIFKLYINLYKIKNFNFFLRKKILYLTINKQIYYFIKFFIFKWKPLSNRKLYHSIINKST